MPFSDLLRYWLKERGLTIREFSRKTKRSASFISDVLQGIIGPSDKTVDGWADELNLTGDERENFQVAGSLVRCPQRIRALLVKMDPKLADLMPVPRPPRVRAKRRAQRKKA